MFRKVLLVEDDRVSRESLAYLLRGLGHDVRAFYSAEDAQRALDGFVPEVALLDVRLPGEQGDKFALHLRRWYPHVRIVFVSGEFRVQDIAQVSGDVRFVPKPVDFGKLLATLQG